MEREKEKEKERARERQREAQIKGCERVTERDGEGKIERA